MNNVQTSDVRDMLERFVLDVIRHKHGPDAVAALDPLVATRETDELADRIRALTTEYALQARGRGSSWHDIAVALHLDRESSRRRNGFRTSCTSRLNRNKPALRHLRQTDHRLRSRL